MGKRLTCPRCDVTNECDVPLNEVITPQRLVPCRGCGHRFSYGFKPEYVTEAERELHKDRPPAVAYDSAVEVTRAKERLERHVMQHRDYHDRDRDVLLLHLIDMAEHLDQGLSAIKRVVDVLSVRSKG